MKVRSKDGKRKPATVVRWQLCLGIALALMVAGLIVGGTVVGVLNNVSP